MLGQVNKPTAAGDNRVIQSFLLKAKDKTSVATRAGKSTDVSRNIGTNVSAPKEKDDLGNADGPPDCSLEIKEDAPAEAVG